MILKSIKEALSDLIDIAGPEYLNLKPTLIRWSKKIDTNIGSYYNYVKKIAVVDIQNCGALPPCDAVKILHILLGDYGCDCDLFTDTLLGQYDNFDVTLGDVIKPHAFYYSSSEGLHLSDVYWVIQGDMIAFEESLDNSYDKATIQYLAYKTDNEGLPMVRESHIPAIAKGLELRLLEKERWRLIKKARMHNAFVSSFQEIKSEYHRLVRDARAKDGEPTESQKLELAEMINNPLSGYGNNLLENLR